MIIAVLNEKGGVGKTTTAVNLASALALAGQHVVAADIDTQHDASLYDHDESDLDVIWRLATPRTLERCLIQEGIKSRSTDGACWGVVDCPAEMGKPMQAAFQVSSLVLVPVDCRAGGRDGLKRIAESVRMARRSYNPTLRLRVVYTMWRKRNKKQQGIIDEVDGLFGGDVLQTRIRHSEMFETAAEKKVPIVRLAPRSSGAHDYRQLAEELSSLCH